MLILERYEGQAVIVDDEVVIRVLKMDWHERKVVLGFDGPMRYVIDREEINERKKAGIPHPKYLTEQDVQCQQKHNTK